ncbi:MAG: GGDEF domain-containing protein [Butyrivibrio sp.]|nr:GGDEF domain-containing protein [Butyrivibrio sp.]
MNTGNNQPGFRDRTYKENEVDYMGQKQFVDVSGSLCVTHIGLEVLYILLGCFPMIIINIISILSYVVASGMAKKGKIQATIWIMITEVYLHVILASCFLGLNCGFHLWLFGSLTSIFIPFFMPNLSRKQKGQIAGISFVIICTFLILTILDDNGIMPTRYNVEPATARWLYYMNAILGFGSIMIYLGIYIAKMSAKSNELQIAADHDFLTGIYNRQRIQKILDAEVLRAQDVGDSNLIVAIVDIDFFKKINDNYGHIVGDEALKDLTQFFFQRLNEGLLFGRWGGEEFLLIAPENKNYDEFILMMEELRKQIEAHELICYGEHIRYTVSIGIAAYEKDMTVENLVNLADDRLYQAKETGRNKTVY